MNKQELIETFLNTTEREGIENLLQHMNECGFYKSPCSGGHHLSCEGGLAEHSLNVYKLASKLNIALNAEIDETSIIICSILHDLGKMGQFGKPYYVPNYVKDGKPTKAEPEQKYKLSESKPFASNSELLSVAHEVRSLQIASQFIELTEEESFAILNHNGLYGVFKYDLSGKETPLYMIIHFADLWASRVVEV